MGSPNPTDPDRPFLDGVRVLDLSRVLAGPMCAQYLGDLGADIVKVEPLGLGDETRGWPPFRPDGSAVFATFNRNKRSIAIDLRSPEGQQVVHRLAAGSDVVIENFGSGVTGRLAVDETTLRAHNPALIYCSITGFGRTGPLSTLPAYDVVMQAFTGMMELTGEIGSGPIRSPVSPIDYVTGMHALAGILAALPRARETGRGTRVDVSLFDTAMGLLAYQIQSYWATGTLPPKNGSSHPSMCPYQAFRASDGPFLLAITNDGQWQRFCATAGRPELAKDPRFLTNADRVANRPETLALVQDMLLQRTGDEWMVALGAARVPCSPINTLADMLVHPQTTGGDVIGHYAGLDGAPRETVTAPVVFDGRQRSPGTAPPRHGEHGPAVLHELGYSEAEVARLLGCGIVAA